MAKQKPFMLFAYGTLTNPWVFRAVLGKDLTRRADRADGNDTILARRALLNGYTKISPDKTYQYAVPDPQGRIGGYIIGPLPPECLSRLRRYEGDNYSRRTLTVQTDADDERAVVFLGDLRKLEHAFGYEFHDHFKQEVILDEKIEDALRATEQEQLHTREDAAVQAIAELRGTTIRDLRRQHFEAGGISDYAIRHSLADSPLPTYERIIHDPEAQALSDNYLRFVVRQVILNQIESHILYDCRYELDAMSPGNAFYDRTLSLLAALRIVNRLPALEGAIGQCLDGLTFRRNHLVDYVRGAVGAARTLYDPARARHELGFIRQHRHRGHVPLGVELEFSDIGHGVIEDPQGAYHRDVRYDGFLYFRDFALDALTWRLGGHIDDHHTKASDGPRRGFFETALGNLSIESNISKPVTDDPWTLNQLIHQTRRFYEIHPHSVHVSFQVPSNRPPSTDRPLPLAILKCLLAIAGEPRFTDDGRLIIGRAVSEEIRRGSPDPTMMFSQVTWRHSSDSSDSHALLQAPAGRGRYVQQFKFLRLSPRLNYEPVIVALKGIQVRLKPGNFLVADQYRRVPKLQRLYDRLLSWAARPEPLSPKNIETFLNAVYEGLMAERRGRPAHSPAYIHWSLDRLRAMLRRFNDLLARSAPG